MINVDLRRYGTDKDYAQFINGYISGADIDETPIECQLVCSVKEEKFVEEFKQYLVEENHDSRYRWGSHQYIFEFPNNYGASVVRHRGSYGHEQGLWEMALIIFEEDDFWEIAYERDFHDDVKGYLTDDNVIELLEKIKQY